MKSDHHRPRNQSNLMAIFFNRCGGEIGIYMVIKECFILLLHDNGGTVMNAPYLDAHGEVDLFLK